MNPNSEFPLSGKKIAIVSAHGFEQSELLEPKKALEEAGAATFIISCCPDSIKGWNEDHFDQEIPVDVDIAYAVESDYDALLLPGGVINPDILRRDERVVEFIRSFFEAKKPVAAICHGPQTLIEANVVPGRKMTSYASIKTDLINAGANWVDEPVVVDQGLVTSRSPADLGVFIPKMIEEFHEGKHEGQATQLYPEEMLVE